MRGRPGQQDAGMPAKMAILPWRCRGAILGRQSLEPKPAMPDRPVIWSLDERGIARVALNRPEVGNAYDGALIDALAAALAALPTSPPPLALLLTGNGRHFQAGADLKWV